MAEEEYNPRIYIEDIRLAGHCVHGARRWFISHNLDFLDFIRNGIQASDFIASGDALAARIVERKREREAGI